jgi:hypothetical protein
MDIEKMALEAEISELKEELKNVDITPSRRDYCQQHILQLQQRILQLGEERLLLLRAQQPQGNLDYRMKI